jgi:hypothetical protein
VVSKLSLKIRFCYVKDVKTISSLNLFSVAFLYFVQGYASDQSELVRFYCNIYLVKCEKM